MTNKNRLNDAATIVAHGIIESAIYRDKKRPDDRITVSASSFRSGNGFAPLSVYGRFPFTKGSTDDRT